MKFFKKLSPILILTILVLISPTTSLAVSGNSESKQLTANGKQNQQSSLEQQKLALLKEKATAEIDRRLLVLNKLKTKIEELKRLNNSQKDSLNLQITNNQTELEGLKTKINSENDLTTLRETAKSITSSYRIFAVFMPKINLLASLEAAENMTDKLDQLATKIDSIVTDLETAGKDTSTLKNTLTQMKERIANTETMIATTEAQVLALDPSGYPGNKTSMKDARNSLAEIRQLLNESRVNAVQLIADIKKLRTQEEPALKGREAGQTNQKPTGELESTTNSTNEE